VGPRITRKLEIPESDSKPPESATVLSAVTASLDDDKAEDVVVIDLNGKTTIADYMVIACGTSQRHVGAMADHLRERLKSMGIKSLAVEGKAQCDWVLIDAGDVVVHVFRPEVRAFYALERLWGAPDLAAARGSGARAGY
jgi:ribosome-associated protein